MRGAGGGEATVTTGSDRDVKNGGLLFDAAGGVLPRKDIMSFREHFLILKIHMFKFQFGSTTLKSLFNEWLVGDMYHQDRNIRSAKSPSINFEISHVFMYQLSTLMSFLKLRQVE